MLFTHCYCIFICISCAPAYCRPNCNVWQNVWMYVFEYMDALQCRRKKFTKSKLSKNFDNLWPVLKLSCNLVMLKRIFIICILLSGSLDSARETDSSNGAIYSHRWLWPLRWWLSLFARKCFRHQGNGCIISLHVENFVQLDFPTHRSKHWNSPGIYSHFNMSLHRHDGSMLKIMSF